MRFWVMGPAWVLFVLASLATAARARLRKGNLASTDKDKLRKSEDKYLDFIYGNSRLTVVSRIHGASATQLADSAAVLSFLHSVKGYASRVILCIGVGDELEHVDYLNFLQKVIATEEFPDFQLVLLPVVPWGKFTSALNAAVTKVAERGDGLVVFQSLEFRISRDAVKSLVEYLSRDESILVIGPRMKGHDFSPGDNVLELRGRTCPWNTFAIWRTKYLALTGFPLVSDGMGGNMGGVEEVTAITLLQQIKPNLQAVLAGISDGVSSWDTNFSDPKRMQWHQDKMRSKDDRPAKQLEWLNMSGKVRHVQLQ